MAVNTGTLALVGVGVVGAVLLLRNRQPQGPPGAISRTEAESVARQTVQATLKPEETIRFVGQARLFDVPHPALGLRCPNTRDEHDSSPLSILRLPA